MKLCWAFWENINKFSELVEITHVWCINQVKFSNCSVKSIFSDVTRGYSTHDPCVLHTPVTVQGRITVSTHTCLGLYDSSSNVIRFNGRICLLWHLRAQINYCQMCSLFQNKYQVFTASDFFSKTHKSNQVEIVAYNIQIIETYIISHVTMY